MVTLSVVVPVHDVADYLGACLDALLGSDAGGEEMEVIAVDDASTDASGALLADRATIDHRLQVISLDVNVGQAEAKNRGLAAATGTYVWFVDGDDLVAPGGLRAVLDAVAGEPVDMLIVDYERFYPDGSVETRTGYPHASGAGEVEVFGPADRERLLMTSPYTWNKVMRRDFLDAHRLRFPGRWYEDQVLVACAALVADRWAVLRRCAYRYRQRPGSATHATSDRHLEALTQWARVLEFFEARPQLEPARGDLVARMVRALVFVIDEPHRLPPERRVEFTKQVCRLYRTHRGAGRPRRLAGVSLAVQVLLLLGASRPLLAAKAIRPRRR